MSASGVHTETGTHYSTRYLLAHAAATATEARSVLFFVTDAVDVTGAWFVPDTAITGDNTNYTNMNLIDVGTAGVGTTEVAHIDFTLAIDGVAFDAKAFATAALSTFTKYSLAAGAVLKLEFEKAASGVAIPAGLLVITYQPR